MNAALLLMTAWAAGGQPVESTPLWSDRGCNSGCNSCGSSCEKERFLSRLKRRTKSCDCDTSCKIECPKPAPVTCCEKDSCRERLMDRLFSKRCSTCKETAVCCPQQTCTVKPTPCCTSSSCGSSSSCDEPRGLLKRLRRKSSCCDVCDSCAPATAPTTVPATPPKMPKGEEKKKVEALTPETIQAMPIQVISTPAQPAAYNGPRILDVTPSPY